MNTPMLRVSQLTTGYAAGRRTKIVAADLTATLQAGTVTALVGKNGTGKSTLLRTLVALQPALGGEVEWGGRPLTSYSARQLAREVSIVLTARVDTKALTAREVVAMGRMPYTGFGGRLSLADREIAAEALALTGVASLADREEGSLSDGERQRVMKAKALAQQTPAILLDEPTAFLDFPGKVAILRLLCDLAEKHGKTILLSTHDLELTFQIVQRLWLLSSEGIAEGSPRRLAENGCIGRFFHTEGVRFNVPSLRFEME